MMDNHESHVSLETINAASENGLVILSFPPHCSHRMQPLDVSIYGPFNGTIMRRALSGCSVTQGGHLQFMTLLLLLVMSIIEH